MIDRVCGEHLDPVVGAALDLEDDVSRERFAEVPEDRTLIILCDAGTRSYEIQVFLDHVGKRNSLVLSGGFNVIRRIGVDWMP